MTTQLMPVLNFFLGIAWRD